MLVKKSVMLNDLMDVTVPYLIPLFSGKTYPWEILSHIGEYAKKLVADGIDGFTEYAAGVLVGEGCDIHPSAVIMPPAVIGKNTTIRPNAYIRGNVITGEGCTIGNSTELKNAILLNNAQVPHYNYAGDSILGNYAHMGAGAICSNLKSDKSQVVVRGEESIATGLKKMGAILGDNVEVGCNSVLNPGTVIGKGARVYPLTSVRGVIPEKSIVKSQTEIIESR